MSRTPIAAAGALILTGLAIIRLFPASAGQDAHLLGQVLKQLAAQQVALRIKTTPRLDQEGLTEVREVPAFEKVTGYVAIQRLVLRNGLRRE